MLLSPSKGCVVEVGLKVYRNPIGQICRKIEAYRPSGFFAARQTRPDDARPPIRSRSAAVNYCHILGDGLRHRFDVAASRVVLLFGGQDALTGRQRNG